MAITPKNHRWLQMIPGLTPRAKVSMLVFFFYFAGGFHYFFVMIIHFVLSPRNIHREILGDRSIDKIIAGGGQC
jgi:hypothetical protein